MPLDSGKPESADLSALLELKRNSTDPKEKQRLPLLQETLRQLEE